jgi:hypothetical protein
LNIVLDMKRLLLVESFDWHPSNGTLNVDVEVKHNWSLVVACSQPMLQRLLEGTENNKTTSVTIHGHRDEIQTRDLLNTKQVFV